MSGTFGGEAKRYNSRNIRLDDSFDFGAVCRERSLERGQQPIVRSRPAGSSIMNTPAADYLPTPQSEPPEPQRNFKSAGTQSSVWTSNSCILSLY